VAEYQGMNEIRGLPEFKAALKALGERALAAAAQALYQEAEAIMTASKETYCPVDTGNLRASGHVDPPVTEGSNVTVTLGYGGPAAPYAVEVHERPAIHRPPTQWQYLSTPFFEALTDMDQRLAAKMKPTVEQV
jgi:bacteriophage HK97-gp10 putative tail-component